MRPYLLLIVISLLATACSQKAAELSSLTDVEVSAKLAAANNQTTVPLPGKLYKMHIAECDAKIPLTADSKCAKSLAENVIFVWGKPTEIGIMYYEDKGLDYQNWATPRQSSKLVLDRGVNVDVFAKSEGCIQNISSLKPGFYPVRSIRHLFTETIPKLIDEKSIYVGAVEQVSDKAAMEEFDSARRSDSKDGDSNDLNNPDQRYRECRGAQKMDLKPQQIIPISPTTSNSQPQQIRYSLAW